MRTPRGLQGVEAFAGELVGGASRAPTRSSTRAPALLVRVEPRPVVRIVASDLLEEEAARPYAVLVEHVVRAALGRGAGAA